MLIFKLRPLLPGYIYDRDIRFLWNKYVYVGDVSKANGWFIFQSKATEFNFCMRTFILRYMLMGTWRY
jgi:hypothetical protein